MHHSLSTEEPSWFQILAIMSEAFVDLHEDFNVNSFRFFAVNRKDWLLTFLLCVWFPEKQLGCLLQWLSLCTPTLARPFCSSLSLPAFGSVGILNFDCFSAYLLLISLALDHPAVVGSIFHVDLSPVDL